MPRFTNSSRYYARQLRKNMTGTEQFLWKYLQKKRFQGAIFRRQFRIGPYITDFICLKSKLIIECDGGQHLVQKEYDQKRDIYLTSQGFQVLRFWDHEILNHPAVVLNKIFLHLAPPPVASRHPPPQGRRG